MNEKVRRQSDLSDKSDRSDCRRANTLVAAQRAPLLLAGAIRARTPFMASAPTTLDKGLNWHVLKDGDTRGSRDANIGVRIRMATCRMGSSVGFGAIVNWFVVVYHNIASTTLHVFLSPLPQALPGAYNNIAPAGRSL